MGYSGKKRLSITSKQGKNLQLRFFPFCFVRDTKETRSDCQGRWRSLCRHLKASCVLLPLGSEGLMTGVGDLTPFRLRDLDDQRPIVEPIFQL